MIQKIRALFARLELRSIEVSVIRRAVGNSLSLVAFAAVALALCEGRAGTILFVLAASGVIFVMDTLAAGVQALRWLLSSLRSFHRSTLTLGAVSVKEVGEQ